VYDSIESAFGLERKGVFVPDIRLHHADHTFFLVKHQLDRLRVSEHFRSVSVKGQNIFLIDGNSEGLIFRLCRPALKKFPMSRHSINPPVSFVSLCCKDSTHIAEMQIRGEMRAGQPVSRQRPPFSALLISKKLQAARSRQPEAASAENVSEKRQKTTVPNRGVNCPKVQV
jgi:hypothetical protein